MIRERTSAYRERLPTASCNSCGNKLHACESNWLPALLCAAPRCLAATPTASGNSQMSFESISGRSMLVHAHSRLQGSAEGTQDLPGMHGYAASRSQSQPLMQKAHTLLTC